MKISKISPFSGNENTMDLPTVTRERLEQCWRFNPNGEGEHIQDVFPELTASEREFLVSGATPEEWEEMFGEVS